MEDRGHKGIQEDTSYCGNSVFFPEEECQPSCLGHCAFGAQSHCYHSNENTDPSGIFGSEDCQ